MKKLKKIIAIMLALAISLSAAVILSSCGTEETPTPCTEHIDSDGDSKCDKCATTVETEDRPTYTVTVKDTDGQKIGGVKIKLSSGSNSSGTFATDINGVATLSVKAEGAVFANVEYVPDGYVAAESKVAFDKGSFELTIVLNKLELETYTVKLVDENGQPVKNVYVQICEGETCRNPQKTDNDGRAEFEFAPSGASIKAKVTSLPDGYINAPGADAEGYVYLVDGENEIVLTIIPA